MLKGGHRFFPLHRYLFLFHRLAAEIIDGCTEPVRSYNTEPPPRYVVFLRPLDELDEIEDEGGLYIVLLLLPLLAIQARGQGQQNKRRQQQ